MNIRDDFSAETPSLGDNEVHVWRVDLNAAAASPSQWEQVLSPEERERTARFRFEKDRLHFSAARSWLRMVLGRYLGSAPGTLRFRYAEKGKPSLDPSQEANRLTFNISHSGGVALFAFTRGREVGIDVEGIRRNFDTEAIARRFFSAAEQARLSDLPADERPEAFFRCWTRKEAYIKAMGEGLSLPLHQFDVSIGVGDQNALLATRPDPGEASLWSLSDLEAGRDFAAAIAVAGSGWKAQPPPGQMGSHFCAMICTLRPSTREKSKD
jgi:4'-phosphopantetheinyl transferase